MFDGDEGWFFDYSELFQYVIIKLITDSGVGENCLR